MMRSAGLKIRNLYARFSILDGLYWLAFIGFNTLTIPYVRAHGITATQVGLMMAAFRLTSFAGQIFWGTTTDRRQQNRKFVLLMFIILAVSYLLLYSVADSWLLVLLAYAACGFLYLPLNTNMDTWIIRSFSGDSQALPKVRSIGVAVSGTGTLIMAILVDRVGYKLMPITLGLFGAAFFALVLLTRPAASAPKVMTRRFNVVDAVKLFRIPGFGFCELILLSLCIGVLTLWIIAPLVLEKVSTAPSLVSMHNLASSVSEMLIMPLAGKCNRKMRSEICLLLAIGFSVCESVTMLIATSTAMVMVSGVFFGIAYSFFFATMRAIVQKLVPPELATTAHGVNDAICLSTAGFIGAVFGGAIIDALGPNMFLTVGIGFELLSLALLGVYVKTEPRRAAKREALRAVQG